MTGILVTEAGQVQGYRNVIPIIYDCLQYMADRGESPKSDFLSILGSWDTYPDGVPDADVLPRDLKEWLEGRKESDTTKGEQA